MNHEDMSDFEVNKAVALKIRGSDEVSIIQHLGLVNIFCGNPKDEDRSNWRSFDPCNNPSDAWPIIVNGRLTISPEDGGDEWEVCAIINDELGFEIEVWDKNPLRSAMICFLKMKDAESE